jgi:hypothetical protein
MERNGTISSWKAANGVDILFPETAREAGGVKKWRGGASVCAPNFGTAPTDGPYEGITLPKHGLVRNCRFENGQVARGNPAFHQWGPMQDVGGRVSAGFLFVHPWSHEVLVSAHVSPATENDAVIMSHRISVGTETIHDETMPCSVGFHPYFATAGDEFTLHYDDQDWSVHNLTVDEAFYIPREHEKKFEIKMSYGDIEIELLRDYNGFYVWTDEPSKYVCVEPVCTGDYGKRYRVLNAGEILHCSCNIKFTPRTTPVGFYG